MNKVYNFLTRYFYEVGMTAVVVIVGLFTYLG